MCLFDIAIALIETFDEIIPLETEVIVYRCVLFVRHRFSAVSLINILIYL